MVWISGHWLLRPPAVSRSRMHLHPWCRAGTPCGALHYARREPSRTEPGPAEEGGGLQAAKRQHYFRLQAPTSRPIYPEFNCAVIRSRSRTVLVPCLSPSHCSSMCLTEMELAATVFERSLLCLILESALVADSFTVAKELHQFLLRFKNHSTVLKSKFVIWFCYDTILTAKSN